MAIIIKEVLKDRELEDFIRFPEKLFADVDTYIAPIRTEEIKTFAYDVNPAYEYCDARLWLALKNNKVVGRVAGIINNRYNETKEVNYARFGWIDFIEDQEVVDKLMHKVEVWAKENGADVVHGPLGFTSFDPSGIIMQGFDEIPTSYARYNAPYYSQLLENAGYNKDIDWIEFNISVPKQIPERIVKGAELVKQRYNLHSLNIRNRRHLLKYTGEVFKLLNRSYSGLYGFSEISKTQAKQLINANWLLLKHAYISLVADEMEKIVGFGLAFPSLSEPLRKAKGVLTLKSYINVYKNLRSHTTVDLLLIAVRSDYQSKGVHAMIFNQIAEKFIKNGVTNIETTKELETNLKVNQLWNKLDSRQHKRSRCYIKNLD